MTTFYVSLYDLAECKLWFCLGDDIEFAKRFGKKHGHLITDDELGGAAGLFAQTGAKEPVIFVSQVPRDSEYMATAMHEIYHFVDWIFRFYAMPISKDTEEARARIFGNVAYQFLEKLRKLKRVNRETEGGADADR